ncbi:hypothetical protein EDC56_0123 [Sinobacterium caligoides]|uniref:Uncharacterized protein n=1 Tax=Sinobacterium caligoides TaxID=933926 RepID=A0A3N2DXV6_9GAMM|nr:hypothetical protein [Sinobacterium caligoides]ROS04617.1 hypothetical protein EDC56_0123 [Sinobacterium caligoides]
MSIIIKDKDGNDFDILLGGGRQWPSKDNLAQCPIIGRAELERFDPLELYKAVNHFYRGYAKGYLYRCLEARTPSSGYRGRVDLLPVCPKIALGDAMVNSELILVRSNGSSTTPPRSQLRLEIANACSEILMDERQHAKMLAAQMGREGTINKALIYTGAAMTGLGQPAWGLAVWLKDVSDLMNPVVRAQHAFRAIQAGANSDDFITASKESLAASEWRELVDVLGFDPNKLTLQHLQQAMAAAEMIYEDAELRGDLTRFAKGYADAQHAIEYTTMAGAAVFELILTLLLLAIGGAGAVVNTARKSLQTPKFNKLGDLLLSYTGGGKKKKSQHEVGSDADAQPSSLADFESEAAGSSARWIEPATSNRRGPPVENADNNSMMHEVDVVPDTVDRVARLEMLQNVRKSLQSSNPGDILEGQVARRYKDQLQNFNKKFGPNGADGEIDVELPNTIIEVSVGLKKGRKARIQRERLLSETLNPNQKPVIQFSKSHKRMTSAQRQHLLDSGLHDVAASFDELDEIIRDLHQ